MQQLDEHTGDRATNLAAGPRAAVSRRAMHGGAARVTGAFALSGFGGLGGAASAGVRTALASAAGQANSNSTPTPQMQEVLDNLGALGPLPLTELTPRQARELPSFAEAVQRVQATHERGPALDLVGSIEHRVIPGPEGSGGLLVRIYTPTAPPASAGARRPVLVYYHGGGWVIANLNVYDGSCRALCEAANAIVVSVAYRQAPEHPFPAAVDDAFAGYQWARENATSFGGDPDHVAVAGESAGGNLAAVTALMAREENYPLPVHQLLVYPVTDFVNEYQSYQTYVAAKPLATPALQWFASHYLPNDAARSDWRASPLLADLRGLPAATIIAAEIDPLRDQVLAYAGRLADARVPVASRTYPSVTHEFFGMTAHLPEARDAVTFAASRLT